MQQSLIQTPVFLQVDYKDLDVQDQIGEGSFGRVYLAKWRETTVAVKVLAGAAPSPDDGEEELAQHRRLLESLEKVSQMIHSSHLALLLLEQRGLAGSMAAAACFWAVIHGDTDHLCSA